MKLLLIGPQGSGKSTQAKLLSEYLKMPYLSTGEIFRSLASQDTEEGKRIKGILDQGKLVDDATTTGLVESRLREPSYQNGFILDGYPRTKEQARLFDPGFDKVFYLKLRDETIMDRLLTRGRFDDTKELIQTRLNLYHQQTQPLLDHYKMAGILIEVDGERSIEEVQGALRNALIKYG